MPKFYLLSLALTWTALVSYLCLVRSSEIPVVQIENLDKWVHSFFHLVFTLVWFLFFRKKMWAQSILRPLVLAVGFSFVFGILIELLQNYLSTTRNADYLDVVANIVGSLLGLLLILFLEKVNILSRILER